MAKRSDANKETGNQGDAAPELNTAPIPPAEMDGEKEAGIATPESAVAEMIALQPEPQNHAIEAHENQQQSDNDKTDKSGARFDPTIHAADAAGNPTLTSAGNFAKRRGRKAGQSTVASLPNARGTVKSAAATGTTGQGVSTIEPAALGLTAAHLTVQIGVLVGGNDFIPKKDSALGVDEMPMLTTVWQQYFEATGKRDFPPGVALAVGLSAYILPRFGQPTVRGRAERAGLWFRDTWRKWRNRKAPAPVAVPVAKSETKAA